jgi:hypothetical protein
MKNETGKFRGIVPKTPKPQYVVYCKRDRNE